MDREDRMRRLEDAIEAFLARDATSSDAAFLAANADVEDLLRPMLASGGDEGAAGEAGRRRLGDLELVREIGRGGMGVVYEADDCTLRRRVAVKVLPRTADTTPSAIVRFRREAEVAASLRHPAVVPVHALGESDQELYLVMRLEHAGSLADVLREVAGTEPARLRAGAFAAAARAAIGRRFPEHALEAPPAKHGWVEAVVAAIAQVADALGHAHAMGVLHRDVKPANILIDAEGRAFLTDFGLACVQGDPGVTHAGSMPGTPHCMAPEQASGDRGAIGPPTDVFALGATLYEALTLARAFPGDTVPSVLFAVVHSDPVAVDRLHPGLPRDLVAIVQTALEKEPRRRYATARELAADLKAFLRGEPVAARPASWLERCWRRAVREPWRAVAAALLLLGVPILAVTVAMAMRSDARTQAGERVLQAEWVDRQLAAGFREAGEGDLPTAREHFTTILASLPEAEEGIAGLSVAAGRRSDREALAELQRHADALRTSQALRRRAGALLLRLGREHEARTMLAGLDGEPVGFDAFLAGYGHIELGHRGDRTQFAAARRLLHRAVVSSGHPRPVFYHEWLHAAAHELDRDGIDAAIAAVQRLWPDDPATWYWVAFARAELGEVPAAFAALGEAIERAPDFVGARLNQARLLRRQGRVAEARDVLEKLLAIAPRRAALHHELGTTLGVLGEHAAAAASLEKALAATPEDRLLRREYAGALSSLGQHQQARRELERCLAIAPDAATWFALALERAGTGDAAGARAGYEAALRLDARHAPSLTNLALLDLRGGDPEAAEDRLQEALAADPGFVPARRALLRLFDARPAEAVAMCRDWVRHGPGVAEAWRHLAWSMVRSDAAELREEALAIARKADQMTGGADPPTRHVLAAALLWNGDASQALTIVQQALSALDPGDRFAPYYRELMQATEARCRRALDPGGRR